MLSSLNGDSSYGVTCSLLAVPVLAGSGAYALGWLATAAMAVAVAIMFVTW